MNKYEKNQVKDIYKDAKMKESEALIFQVLSHLNEGRCNVELIKQKLIQAAKNLPIVPSNDMLVYYGCTKLP